MALTLVRLLAFSRLFVVLSVTLASNAEAILIQAQYSGSITDVSYGSFGNPTPPPGSLPLPPEWTVGASFSGFYAYDTDDTITPDPLDPADYIVDGAMGWTMGSLSSSTSNEIEFFDSSGSGDVLVFEVLSVPISGAPSHVLQDTLTLLLGDSDGTWFDGTVPAAVPELSDLEVAQLSILGYGGNGDYVFFVTGEITSLTPIPQPSAGLLLLAGLSVLSLLSASRRRRPPTGVSPAD